VVGLERVSENRPNLILLDLVMPEMDGFTFVHELRKRPGCETIPVVVISAMDLTAEDRERLNGSVEKILQKSGGSWQIEEQREVNYQGYFHCAVFFLRKT